MSETREEMLNKLAKVKHLSPSEAKAWSALDEEEFLDATLKTIEDEGIITQDRIKSTKRSDLWNSIATAYFLEENDYDTGLKIYDKMVEVGSNDPVTLSNYGAFLMDRNPQKARVLIIQAFDKDMERPLHEAMTLPAFSNLPAVLWLEAHMYYEKKDRFLSLVLAWQSIEYSLRSLWLRFLEKKEFSTRRKKNLGRWDVGHIIETLSISGELTTKQRKDISKAKEKRNRVFHARGKVPTLKEIAEIIHVAHELFDVVRSQFFRNSWMSVFMMIKYIFKEFFKWKAGKKGFAGEDPKKIRKLISVCA